MRAKKLIAISLPAAVALSSLVVLNAGTRQKAVSPEVPPELPFKLKTVFSMAIEPVCPAIVADVDRDGNDDILLNEPDRLAWYRLVDDRMTLAGEGAYERPGSARLVTDADGDGYLEYLEITDPPGGSMLSCYDWFSPDSSASPRYTIGPLFSNLSKVASRPWKRMRFYGGYPGGADGGPMILALLNPRENEDSVRSAMAWDGKTGRVSWRYKVKQGQDLVCGDFGSGDSRVVVTTVAISSDPEPDGLNGHVARLICLDPRDGRRIWERRLGGFGGRGYLALADLDVDGRNELIVSRSLPPNDSTLFRDPMAWNVAVMNGEGTMLRAKHLPVRPEALTAANLDEDPYPEILVSGNRGELIVLDEDLDIVRVVAAPRILNAAALYLFGVDALARDGHPCIVGGLGRALVVRDREGNTLAQKMYGRVIEPGEVVLAHSAGGAASSSRRAKRSRSWRSGPSRSSKRRGRMRGS